jgi:hypothetical protein
LILAEQVSSLESLDDEALFGPGSSVNVSAPSPEVEESSHQHLQPQMEPTSTFEQVVDAKQEVSLGLQQDPEPETPTEPVPPTEPETPTEPEPPTSENNIQSDIEEPVDAFGFDGNDSDGGISMPSDDASIGASGLSDDEFEVSCAPLL